MHSHFFKSTTPAKDTLQLVPKDVLLYLLNFLNGNEAIYFEISLGSQRKNLLKQYAGEKVDTLKFKALAHEAPSLLEKLNKKIEENSKIAGCTREEVLANPFSSLTNVEQLSESILDSRIIKHFVTDKITTGEMHDHLFDFIVRETARGTYVNQNACLLFKMAPVQEKEKQEQEVKKSHLTHS